MAEIDACLATPARDAHYASVALQLARAFREATIRVGADHVWMPTGDLTTQALGLSVGRRRRGATNAGSETILHRVSPAYPAPSAWSAARRRLLGRLLFRSPWTRIHIVDRLAYESLLARGYDDRRLRFVPDPLPEYDLPDRRTARRALGIPEGGRVIGNAGALDHRKGIPWLLAAFAKANLREDDRVLLAGRATDTLRQEIGDRFGDLSRSGRLIHIDRYLGDDELMTCLSAMDVVCTPSSGHIGMSSILLRAQAARRPVLGCDEGWQAMIIDQFGVGWTGPVRDAFRFGEAIERALAAAGSYVFPSKAERLLAFHGLDNWAAHVTDAVRERMGLPTPEKLSWSWATEGR
ncbi:MAG: glycosyltransferase [Planctomycetota bacterium]